MMILPFDNFSGIKPQENPFTEKDVGDFIVCLTVLKKDGFLNLN